MRGPEPLLKRIDDLEHCLRWAVKEIDRHRAIVKGTHSDFLEILRVELAAALFKCPDDCAGEEVEVSKKTHLEEEDE